MAKDLLKFLFGESQVDEEIAGIVESIADMDADEDGGLKVDKQPLAKALSALDIDTKGLENDPRGLSLVFTNGDEYRAAHAILNEPTNLHKLAELGWVFSTQGDVAQTREPAEFRIRFLEISEVEPQNENPKPTKGTAKNTAISAVIKKGREFATTKPPHDDDMNPVDHADPKDGGRHKGVGDAKDGAHPEGKPKGVGESDQDGKRGGIGKEEDGKDPKGTPKGSDGGAADPSTTAARLAGLTKPKDGEQPDGKMKGVNEMTTTGSMGTVDAPGLVSKNGIMHAPGCDCEDCKRKDVGEAKAKDKAPCKYCGSKVHDSDNCPTGFAARGKKREMAEGGHKSGCKCGFCMNKGNIHTRGKEKKEGEETTESAADIVDSMLEGRYSNPGTPPGITGHKSYPGMKVGSPDRKFAPAKGMVQPDNPIVNQQSKRKVKSV